MKIVMRVRPVALVQFLKKDPNQLFLLHYPELTTNVTETVEIQFDETDFKIDTFNSTLIIKHK